MNVNGQWLNVGISVDLRENPPTRRDIQSPEQRFLCYVMDYRIESLSDVMGQLIDHGYFTLQDDQNGGGRSAQVFLRPNPPNAPVTTSPISWYGPAKRESKSPHQAGETQRSAIVIGAYGERLNSILDYDLRERLDTKLRLAEPAYDGVRGLAQHLFPGVSFEGGEQTLTEVVADLPFEIQFMGDAKLIVRASPRAADGALTARLFYEPGIESKSARIVFRHADAKHAKDGMLRWEHSLPWPTNSKSVKVMLFYDQTEIQSAQRTRAALRRARLLRTLQSQHEDLTRARAESRAPRQRGVVAQAKGRPEFKTALEVYRSLGVVGEGATGIVYKVEAESGGIFAAKCLDPSKATTEKRKRFRQELHFCIKNEHKNIVTVVDQGITSIDGEDRPFYVMPYYPRTLRDLMKEGIPHERILLLFSQILDGVEAAHLKKVWHRDLKPENVLCAADGEPLVVADFGIAHFAEEELYTLLETSTRDRLANFQYAAPEQRARGRQVDHRADIYALGLILNEMFTGHVPQGVGFRRISDVAPQLAYLDEIVDRMVQQSPDNRPSSIDEIKRTLQANKNDLISRQKLDQLRNTVIPASTIDDPFVQNPITIEQFDVRDGNLVAILNVAPPPDWIRIFTRQPVRSFVADAEPANWSISGKEAVLRFHPQRFEAEAKLISEYFKGYVENANALYLQHLQAAARQREANEAQALRERIAEEERRQRILSKLKI